MTYSAFLVALRSSFTQRGGNQVRQGVNRAAQEMQRPLQNQAQRTASTQVTESPPKHPPFTDEEAYDFLAMDVSLGRL